MDFTCFIDVSRPVLQDLLIMRIAGPRLTYDHADRRNMFIPKRFRILDGLAGALDDTKSHGIRGIVQDEFSRLCGD
jgi:hypothetical protein